jgi:hypothetical protein
MSTVRDPETGIEYTSPVVEPKPDTARVVEPNRVPLPCGGDALMYTRENVVYLYRCSHGELGRLLRAKLAPLPIRIDGGIVWFVDEILRAQATVTRTLERWRKR